MALRRRASSDAGGDTFPEVCFDGYLTETLTEGAYRERISLDELLKDVR